MVRRYSFFAVGSTSSKRMQIVSTLPALFNTPCRSFLSCRSSFPCIQQRNHLGDSFARYMEGLWVSNWGSSLKSWEEGLNTTTMNNFLYPLENGQSSIIFFFSYAMFFQADKIRLRKLLYPSPIGKLINRSRLVDISYAYCYVTYVYCETEKWTRYFKATEF